jgi:hypothetical protein
MPIYIGSNQKKCSLFCLGRPLKNRIFFDSQWAWQGELTRFNEGKSLKRRGVAQPRFSAGRLKETSESLFRHSVRAARLTGWE